MAAFFDTRCQKCGARIGWSGEYSDRPPCHKCGAAPPPDDDTEAKLAEFREKLLEKKMLENE